MAGHDGQPFSHQEVTTMSNVLSRSVPAARSWALPMPTLLSVLRMMTGLLFLEHGTGKLLGFPAGLPFIDKMPAGLLYFTGTMELVGGVLITIGLFTRPVAFILSGFMAAAYFMAHFPMSFFPALNFGEPALLYCFIFLYLAAGGPGPWALDRSQTGSVGRCGV
jgi:putative oxidoreductase